MKKKIFPKIFIGLLSLILILVLMYIFISQPHLVTGRSMEPTLQNGKQIFSNKLIYRFRDPLRGEIIIFNSPQDRDLDFIARVIAIPGDRIMISKGNVYLNGLLLEEPYLFEDNSTSSGKSLSENEEKLLENDEYFVMGDRRALSNDSRIYGVVARDLIIGKYFSSSN